MEQDDVNTSSLLEKTARAYCQLPYFNGLSERLLPEFYKNSIFRCFRRDDILLGFGEGCPTYAYFVLEGECVVLQGLQLTPKKSVGHGRSLQKFGHPTALETISEPFLTKNNYIRLVQLAIFYRGATFNIGEDMTGRCVVARTLVVWCLLVPRAPLLQHGNADNVWTRLRLLLHDRLPKSAHHLGAMLRRERAWRERNRHLANIALARNIL